jgi:hypothetical protein
MTHKLEDWEMDNMRATATDFSPDTMNVYRVTERMDDYGGYEEDEDLLYSDIPCYVEAGAKQEHEQVVAGKVDERELFIVSFSPHLDVRVDDVLVILGREHARLSVRAVLGPEAYEVERYVIAVR